MTQIKKHLIIREARAHINGFNGSSQKMEKGAAIEDAVAIYDTLEVLEGILRTFGGNETETAVKEIKADYIKEIAKVYIKAKATVKKYETEKKRAINSYNGNFQNIVRSLQNES